MPTYGAPDAGVLLEVHELLGGRQAAAAVLDRPVQAGVAGVVEQALPAGVVGAADVPVPGRRRRAVRRRPPRRARPGPPCGRPRRPRSSAGPSVSLRCGSLEQGGDGARGRPCRSRCAGSSSTIRISVGQLVAGEHRGGVGRAGRRRSTGSASARSSTAATGTAPSRRSSRPTTAAPRTAGWRSSAARTSSGRTLKPPRMIAWSARPRIQRKPSASMRARSVVRTQPPSPSWPALTSSRPSASAASGVARRRGRRRAARSRRGPGRRSPAWSPRTRGGPRGSTRPRRRRTRWRA